MAQLVLISPNLFHTGAYKQGLCKDGDIVGIFEDSHVFSELEHKEFEIAKIEGYTKTEFKARLNQLKPKEQWVQHKENRWYVGKPKTRQEALYIDEVKEVWQHTDGKWYFLEKKDKYDLSADMLTLPNKLILADKDSPTELREAAISKIRNRYHLKPENLIEVTITKIKAE